jgi:glycosyltransferase involved in cell wall biosynthesis
LLDKELHEWQPSVLLVEHVENAAGISRWLARRVPQPNVAVILVSHGLHSLDFMFDAQRAPGLRSVLKRLRRIRLIGRMLETERKIVSAVEAVWSMNATEAEVVRWLGGKRVSVMPQACVARDIACRPVRGRFGYVGSLSHALNASGLDSVIGALGSRGSNPETLEIRVVGSPYASMKRRWSRIPQVAMLGPLSEDAFLAECASWSAMIHPLFVWGKGRSLKVTTALELGLPLISTAPGVRGYDLEPGRDFVCAEDPQTFLGAMVRAAEDPKGLAKIGARARAQRDAAHTITRCQNWIRDEFNSFVTLPTSGRCDEDLPRSSGRLF